MARRPHRRRRIIVGGVQYRLLATNLAYFVIVLLIFAAALFGPPIIQMNSGVLSSMETQKVAEELLTLHVRVWPPLLGIFLLLAVHSLFASHRIAGPLYRFRKTFEAIANGDLTVRARLRSRDHLTEEAVLLNRMVEQLGDAIRDVQEARRELCGACDALRGALENGSRHEIDRRFRVVEAHLARLERELNRFTTADGVADSGKPHERGGPPIRVVDDSRAAGSG